jgi:hypothetical protein
MQCGAIHVLTLRQDKLRWLGGGGCEACKNGWWQMRGTQVVRVRRERRRLEM